MVSSLEDIRRAKEYISCAREELNKKDIPCAEMKIGIMIEVPSIALISDLAVKEVDFASIGSNDLCQYLNAADRTNSAVNDYYSPYHPAVFKLIKETVAAFMNAGKPISICGELGSDPVVVPVLIGLGLRKLSMGAASIAAVKRIIASISFEKAKEAADNVLVFSTAGEIEEYLKK
jgi:phosphotransferase system enzyme I (PtsI)